jgi:hypothetical protein
MLPEEFNNQFKVHIKNQLSTLIESLKREIIINGEVRYDKLRELAKNPIDIVDYGKVDRATLDKMSVLSISLQRDSNFNQLMDGLTRFIQKDEEMKKISNQIRLSDSFDEVSLADQNYMLNSILKNEELILGPIHYILNHKDYRELLEVEIDYEEYIEKFRNVVSKAKTLNDVYENKEINLLGMSENMMFAVVPVAVLAFVTVAALAHTLIVTVSYAFAAVVAFTEIAVTAIGPDNKNKEAILIDVKNECINQSKEFIWVIADTYTGRKKFPIAPARSSKEYGIQNIIYLLVGGAKNPLQQLELNNIKRCSDIDFSHYRGVFEIQESVDLVKLIPTNNNEFVNVQFSNESEFEWVAEAFPSAFEIERFTKNQEFNKVFYGSLKTSKYLTSLFVEKK